MHTSENKVARTSVVVKWAVILAVFTLCLMSAPVLAADVEPQPPNCPEGYVCLTLSELAERTAFIWQLQAERTLLRARARRFGFTVGCGVGVAGVVDEDFQTRTAPALACGAFYGFRF